jgi:hypothetical protein
MPRDRNSESRGYTAPGPPTISEGPLVTPSEKPERSTSNPEQDEGSTSVTTQTVEDGAERSSAPHEGDEATTDAASGSDEDVSQSQSGELLEGTETPPPWQRASAPTSGGASGATEASTARSGVAADSEDTQKIPRPAPESAANLLGGSGANPGAGQSGKTSVPFVDSAPRTGSSGTSPGGTTGKRPSRGPRRASLQVKRVDPWSVLKLALVLSVALFFVWMIAVAVLYGVLDGMGVWDQLNGTFTELTQPDNAASQPLISAGGVFSVAAIIGAINIVLITALATVAAFVYNVAADLAGGIEVTLSERE